MAAIGSTEVKGAPIKIDKLSKFFGKTSVVTRITTKSIIVTIAIFSQKIVHHSL